MAQQHPIGAWGRAALAMGVVLLAGWTVQAQFPASAPPPASAPSPYDLPPPRQPGEPVPPGNAEIPASGDLVEDVRVLGVQTTPLAELQKQIKTRADRAFDPQLVEEDVRRLNAMRRFVTVDVSYQNGPRGGRIIIFRVVERPVLKYVKYVGNTVRDRTIEKQTGIKPGDMADPFMVIEGARKLEEWYHTKGYPGARVEIFEGDKPGDRGAVFVINEGQKQRVWEVKFVGNTIATDARLRTIVQSKTPILYFFKGEVDRKKIDEDVDRLVNYYRGLGFFRARVGRELEFNEQQNWLTLTFVVDEGPRYVIRNVSVIGNTQISSNDLLGKIKLKTGDYFDRETQNVDITEMQDAYGSVGYVFAAVEAETLFLEEPGQLDLLYKIEEGDRYRIGRINVYIEGENPRTRRNTVLNRVSMYPGQIADIRELRDSERRLKASGLFMTDMASGVAPRIVFREPDFNDAAFAKRPGGGGSGNIRGQSPDPGAPRERVVDVDFHGRLRPEIRGEDEPLQRPETVSPADPQGVPRPPLNFRGQSPGPAQSWNPTAGTPQVYSTSPGYNAPQAYAPQPGYGSVPMARTSPDAPSYGVHTSAYQAPGTPQPTATQVQYQAPASPYGTPSTVPPSTNYGAPAQGQPVYSQPANGQPGAPAAAYGAQPQFGTLPAYGQAPPGGALPAPGLVGPRNGYDPGDLSESIPPGPMLNGLPGTFNGPPLRELDADVFVRETQTGRIQLNVGVNSNAGLIGGVLIDEQNFDWRRVPSSWEDVRNGTAFRGAGQQFRIEAYPGTEVSRYSLIFREPYFLDTPVSYTVSGYFFNRFYQDWTEERLGGRVGFGYQFTPDLSGNVSLRAENVNMSDPRVPTPPELADVLGNTAFYSGRVDLTHDTRDSPFLATQGHVITLGFEQAFGSFSFPRANFSASQYFLLRERPDRSGRHVLSLITDLGISGTQTPIYEMYYAGGYGSLRGFRFRGVTPLNMDVQIGGKFQWLNSAEYLFPITADDMLRGVLFCDYGTVERSVKLRGDSFRVALGGGLRIQIPAMGPAPIALDFAAPINNADGDQVQNFSFFVGYAR